MDCRRLSCVSALAVVPLQLRPGSGPRRPHFALQAEEQQRPHVAGGGHTGRVWQKGDTLIPFPSAMHTLFNEASDGMVTHWL